MAKNDISYEQIQTAEDPGHLVRAHHADCC
jgi:hypothetical protein